MTDFFTYEFFTRLITSLLGTLAFAILFRCRARHLPYASACGLFTYAIYYTVDYFFGSIFSRPPMYGRSTSGINSEPSFCW